MQNEEHRLIQIICRCWSFDWLFVHVWCSFLVISDTWDLESRSDKILKQPGIWIELISKLCFMQVRTSRMISLIMSLALLHYLLILWTKAKLSECRELYVLQICGPHHSKPKAMGKKVPWSCLGNSLDVNAISHKTSVHQKQPNTQQNYCISEEV